MRMSDYSAKIFLLMAFMASGKVMRGLVMPRYLTAFLLSFVCGTALSAECDPTQVGEVSVVSREAAQKLVEESFLGGKEITSELIECSFESEDGTFEAYLTIRWRGVLMRWNEYQVWGRLTYSTDELRFTPTDANDKVQELKFWGNIARHGVSIVRN
jgi:hypothetical protein